MADVDAYERASDGVSLMTRALGEGARVPGRVPRRHGGGASSRTRRRARTTRGVEEERRLCYVGMTRAMERLTLTWALERRRYGARTFGTPSRFLSEIPASLVVGSSPDAYEPPPSLGSGAAGRVLDYSVAQDEAAEAGGGGRGARVRHPIFGAGVVLESQGSGPGASSASASTAPA